MTSLIGKLPVEPANLLVVRNVAEIELIAVHWSAGFYPDGYAPKLAYKAEALKHIRRDYYEEEPGAQGGYSLMYHERISRDGQGWLTRPAHHVTWSCRGANVVAYNVCVDAGPGAAVTTGAQMEALAARLRCLVPVLGLSMAAVWGHGEQTGYGNRTKCPGDRVRELCRRFRRGEV